MQINFSGIFWFQVGRANMTKNKKNPPPSTSPKPKKHLNFKLGEHLFGRVDKHIRALKYVKKEGFNKKEWMASAIREKLANEDISIDSVPRDKFFNIPVDPHLHDMLERRIEFIKKFRSYSTKQLIQEAIQEKLEREEAKTAKLIEKLHSVKK